MKKPKFPAHSIERKRIYILQELPAAISRTDAHWQIFDDYTAWPEFRLRQIRMPETREWFRAKETLAALNTDSGVTEEFSRILISEDDSANGPHPENEIRKNRYFHEFDKDRGAAIDVFLGRLWGLVLAQIEFADDEEMARFSLPDFALLEVSGSEFFRGENLVKANFDEVRKVVSNR